MPRGRRKSTINHENTISVTPRTRNGRKSASARCTARKTSVPRQSKASNGRRISNATISKDKKPWEESEDETEYRHYGSDLDSENDDIIKDEPAEDQLSETSEDVTDIVGWEDDGDAIFCPWKEIPKEELPVLNLPCSSSDLLVDKDNLFDALEVYEILRVYRRTIQISPFLFEDFCCAMRSPAHFNILLLLLEPMTFAEILKQYAESDPSFSPEVVNILRNTNYPFVELGKRMIILKWLCERFFETATFKKLLKNEGKLVYDLHCRDCGKPGDLLLCDGCDASYHLACANLDEVPEQDQWFCQICEIHNVKGVSDCGFPGEVKRLQPLGYDRHGRLYWFVARRLFVQDVESNDVYYYSTLPQVHELFSTLDPNYYEQYLCKALRNMLPSIAQQMRITLELTDERRFNLQRKTQRESPYPYLHVDNIHRMSSIVADVVLYGEETSQENIDQNDSVLDMKLLKSLLCIEDGHLVDEFWTGQQNESQLLDYHHRLDNELASATENSPTANLPMIETLQTRSQRGYRLGFSDGEYRDYINQYSVNDFAKSPYMRAKERDKRKYMSSRFSLMDEGEFSWTCPKGKSYFAGEADVVAIIQTSLKRLMDKIPDELMHRLWIGNGRIKDRFLQDIHNSKDFKSLRMTLLQYEKAVRKPVFSSVWWSSLGHTKLIRTTAEERERKQKLDALKKRDERALMIADPLTEPDIVWVKYSRLGGPPKHNLWRMKDEQYRVNGREALGGWIWFSSALHRKFVDPPMKPKRGIMHKIVIENPSLADKRALRLEKLVALWKSKGDLKMDPSQPDHISQSNSDSCREGILKSKNPAEVRGEGLPFPLHKPYEYKTRSGKRTLLRLPQSSLRKLARQGGLKAETFIPGFHKLTKSNATVWPYPCSRPLFDNCWRYLTLNSNSLHAVALQFRVMYACIRWADLNPDEDDEDPRIWSHHPDYDEVRTVIGHKENPPDGYYEQYRIKVEQYNLDDSFGDESEDYRSTGRSSTRNKSRKRTPQSKQKIPPAKRRCSAVHERMIDGVELKLYEIKQYWHQYFKGKKFAIQHAAQTNGRLYQRPQVIVQRILPRDHPASGQSLPARAQPPVVQRPTSNIVHFQGPNVSMNSFQSMAPLQNRPHVQIFRQPPPQHYMNGRTPLQRVQNTSPNRVLQPGGTPRFIRYVGTSSNYRKPSPPGPEQFH
ncbi:DDT domain-containing protein [Ditylenchus destructor]|uniref:DDT domain-containing protein n=1 Tax=Ditylenchus destructor TaxID=166010 RepID=A0AAD4R3E9_9BILA|nr:DDT domain-containing protein [Ditylenchus destructor]